MPERVCQLAPAGHARRTNLCEVRPHRLVEAIRLGARTAFHTAAPYLAPFRASVLDGRAEAVVAARVA